MVVLEIILVTSKNELLLPVDLTATPAFNSCAIFKLATHLPIKEPCPGLVAMSEHKVIQQK